MAIPLKYNTASQEFTFGQALDNTDGDTEEGGLTIANTDIKLHKAGTTTLASKNSGGATYISNGVWYGTFDATDTNTYGPMTMYIHVAGALSMKVEFDVMNADAYNMTHSSTGFAKLVDDVWDETLTGATHNVPASAGRRLRSVGDVTSGTVNDASATTTSFISTLTGAHDDHFADQTLFFTDGDLAGMSRIITSYITATKEITFDEPLPAAPSNGVAFDVNPIHVHTQSQIADVVWDEILTGASHNITNSSGKTLREIKEIGVYQNGGIWYDSVSGASGSTAYENGTVDNPVDNEADLRSLIASTGFKRVFIAPGSGLTLAGSYSNTAFIGKNWALALGGQTVDGMVCLGAVITGIGGATSIVRIEDCNIGAATMPPGKYANCGIGDSGGTFTAASAGEYIFENSFSVVPGSGTPNMVFTGLAATTGINNRGWRGGATYTLDSDCMLSHEVVAGGGTSVTTGGADVEVRGTIRSLTLVLGTATSETVQFVGVVGPINISGNPTAAVINLYGIANSVTDTSTGSTVTNKTVNSDNINAILADTNELQGNQGDWATATGFATETKQDAQDAIITEARLAELDTANIPSDLDNVLLDTGTTLPALIDDLAIKKNTSGLIHIEMVLTSDHVTPATGLTVTAQRLIDSGTYANVSGSMTEISNGTYRFDYSTADANGDLITWKFSSGTADDTKLTFKTVA